MARKIIYICDKCGSKSENEDLLRAAYEYEICDKCFKKFDEHIKAFFEGFDAKEKIPYKKPEVIETPEKPKAEKPADDQEKPKRKKIDWNKACALKLAGWSNKGIAEELGVNKPTIDSMIYKMLERYNDGERFGSAGTDEDDEYELLS